MPFISFKILLTDFYFILNAFYLIFISFKMHFLSAFIAFQLTNRKTRSNGAGNKQSDVIQDSTREGQVSVMLRYFHTQTFYVPWSSNLRVVSLKFQLECGLEMTLHGSRTTFYISFFSTAAGSEKHEKNIASEVFIRS